MKIINVSVITGERGCLNPCVRLIEAIPDFDLVAESTGLSGRVIWPALAQSDVVILDEGVIEREGFDPLRSLLEDYPQARCLMVVHRRDEDRMIWAMLRGVRGVMCLDQVTRLLPKAVRKLDAGEVWLPRGLSKPLRLALQSGQYGLRSPPDLGNGMKLH